MHDEIKTNRRRRPLISVCGVALLLAFGGSPINGVKTPSVGLCPIIRISDDCTSEKKCCGPIYVFTVNIVIGRLEREPSFKWTVGAGGKIKNGQGTSSIEVDATAANGNPFAVKVEVGNVIPKECSNTESYTVECRKPN
jgi:hypothetical protein